MADATVNPQGQQPNQNEGQNGVHTDLNPLVSKIRSKYPGVYDDLDDAALTKGVLAKYPQYSDLAAPPVPDPKQSVSMLPVSLLGGGTHYMIGGEPIQSMGQQLGGMAQGMANDAKQLSTPGIAATVLKKRHPELSSAIESVMSVRAANPEELVTKAMMTLLPMAAGGMDQSGPPKGSSTSLPRTASKAEVANIIAKNPRALPPGQYEAPASTVKPQGQLGSGVIEGEYMPEPLPATRGRLQRGSIPQPGGFEPNQLALPERGTAIPLPAANQAARQPVIKTTPSDPLKPLTTTESAAEESSPVKIGKFTAEKPNPPYVGSRVPPKMDLVDSTNVTKVGYHPESQTMMVEYRNGRVYEYRGVPEEIYQQAKGAESIGSFISRNVKGRYTTNYRGSTLGKK